VRAHPLPESFSNNAATMGPDTQFCSCFFIGISFDIPDQVLQ
jgi:hypothetical protein